MSASPSQPRPAGVLVVDDERLLLRLLSLALSQAGFAVWTAPGGEEAVELYRRHGGAVDVVLLDVCMPGMDGPKTLAALRALDPAVRCCLLTGHAGAYSEEGLLALGADRVLLKPFPLDELTRVLRGLAG
jgi:CheY-like chemotaxis protein